MNMLSMRKIRGEIEVDNNIEVSFTSFNFSVNLTVSWEVRKQKKESQA